MLECGLDTSDLRYNSISVRGSTYFGEEPKPRGQRPVKSKAKQQQNVPSMQLKSHFHQSRDSQILTVVYRTHLFMFLQIIQQIMVDRDREIHNHRFNIL